MPACAARPADGGCGTASQGCPVLKAALLVLLAVPPLLCVLFMPGYLWQIREEISWRAHRDPYVFLNEWPQGRYQSLALAELDAVQRDSGFITRLLTPRYDSRYLRGSEVLSARWSDDESRVLTGSTTVATIWDAASGRSVATHGATHRRDVEAANKWGFGFHEVAWYDGGRGVVGMTSGPHSLWFHAHSARAPILLEGDGYEGLTGLDGRVAVIKNLEHGVVIDVASGRHRRLPHTELNTIALLAGDTTLTASRTQVQWWQGEIKGRTVAIAAPYNPVGFSGDGRWALVLAQRTAELWSTHSGARIRLEHDAEVTALCAQTDTVVTGTEAGTVHLWSAADGRPLRRFRAGTMRIDALACGARKLLSLSYNRTDARLWDLSGRAQHGASMAVTPPRQHVLVRWGADIDLPGRAPAFARWIEENDVNGLNPHAGGALLLVAGLAWWLARRPHAQREG